MCARSYLIEVFNALEVGSIFLSLALENSLLHSNSVYCLCCRTLPQLPYLSLGFPGLVSLCVSKFLEILGMLISFLSSHVSDPLCPISSVSDAFHCV